VFKRSQDMLHKYWPETGIIQNKEDRGIQFGCEKLQWNWLNAIVDVLHTSTTLNLQFTLYVRRGQNRDLYWQYTLARLVFFITPPPKNRKVNISITVFVHFQILSIFDMFNTFVLEQMNVLW